MRNKAAEPSPARMLEELGDPNPEPSHAITLIARLRGSPGNHFRNDPDEFIYIDLWSNGEVRTQQSAVHGQQTQNTDLRPLEEDVVLQLDAFGDDVQFWAWPHGEPRPEEPIIQYTAADKPAVLHGGFGFGSFYAKAAFRYVLASDKPIEDLAGDFNFDFQLSASDIDLLSDEISSPVPRPWFDLNGDSVVTEADRGFWVESEDVAHTFFGDANLDGEFNRLDLIEVLLSGKYGLSVDAGWAEGDWTGDGRFDRRDILLALQEGGYGPGSLAAVSAVPEPSSAVLLIIALLGILRLRQLR